MPGVLDILVDSKNTALYKFKNEGDAQNDPNTRTVIGIAKKILIPIDEDMANRHGIKDGDKVSLIEDGTPGRITLVFKDTQNKVTGNHHEANNQDYGE